MYILIPKYQKTKIILKIIILMNGIGICKWCGSETRRSYSSGYQLYCSERCNFQHSEALRVKREREEERIRLENLNYQNSLKNEKNKTYINLNEVQSLEEAINKYKSIKSGKTSFKNETIIIRKEDIEKEDDYKNNNQSHSFIDELFSIFKNFLK